MMNKRPWVSLKKRITRGSVEKVIKLLASLSPSERARAVSRLDKEDITKLLLLIPPNNAADLLGDLPDEQASDLIERLPTKDAKDIVDEFSATDQADILADMKEQNVEAILGEMAYADAEKTRGLLQYPEDSAGGIMQTEFLAYEENGTVGQVLDDLQNNGGKYSDYQIQYIYLVSNTGELKGVLRLRDILFSSRQNKINSLTVIDPLHVRVDMHLDELVQIFEKKNYIGVPVTNQNREIVGVVHKRDVLEAFGERNKDTYLKASGIIGGEELRSMPFLQRSKRRLSWLSVNIVLNVLAASVIAFYQETLSSVIALAVFLPIISDMSGCSGNQAVAVSIRELTLGLVKPLDLFSVLLKEMWIGILNGIVLGLILGAVAFLWKGNPYFGLVVGGALAINTLVAVCLGGMIPLYLRKFGKDPALASGPILTTVTDMCGFFFALGFATMLLPQLK